MLGLTVFRLYEGEEAWIELIKEFEYIDGRRAAGTVAFGQSIAVLKV